MHMDSFILGTAGHIDHGKSALIMALTGIEPDRLKEEKKRGISIVLGYADISFSSGISIGIVDVPGHLKFIKTMVSGSTGMNGVLFVIAADDGIMAQTREHLLILKLLGIDIIIPVLTKIDIVSDETILTREREIKYFLKSYGYINSSQNIIRVSAKSGKGISELKNEIEKAIKGDNAKRTALKSMPSKIFLSIDRIITLKGFGTVLAGTLKYGNFSVGDEMQIMPAGFTARVKDMESHNKKIPFARRAMRISLNVPSVKKESVRYGDVICVKDSLMETDSVFTRFFYDTANKKDFKNRTLLTFMTGGVSVGAKGFILSEKKRPAPGDYAYVLFKLQNKISTMSGERFITRDAGAAVTVGGGVIIDPLADYRYDKSKEFIYEGMLSDDYEKSVYSFIAAGGNGNLEEIYKRLNLNSADFTSAIEKLKKDGLIITDGKNKFAFPREDFDAGKSFLIKTVSDSIKSETEKKKNAFKNGIGRQELCGVFERNFNKPESLFNIVMDDLLSKKELVNEDGTIILKGFENKTGIENLPDEYVSIIKRVEGLLKTNDNSVPNLAELEKKIGADRKALNYVLSLMIKEGRVIKVKRDIFYLKEQVEDIKKGLYDFFKSNKKLEPKDIKEIAGVSRKYAIPLLEYFDHIGYTVKRDNYRIKRQ